MTTCLPHGKIKPRCGRGQAVRQQPSKLSSAGSNPVARSGLSRRTQRNTKKNLVNFVPFVLMGFWARGAVVSAGDS